jgi:hypothetical protein
MSILAIVPDAPTAETIQTTATYLATAEPTAGDIVDIAMVQPQGSYEVKFPAGRDIIVGGGGRIAIDCTAPATVNVRAKFLFEE